MRLEDVIAEASEEWSRRWSDPDLADGPTHSATVSAAVRAWALGDAQVEWAKDGMVVSLCDNSDPDNQPTAKEQAEWSDFFASPLRAALRALFGEEEG